VIVMQPHKLIMALLLWATFIWSQPYHLGPRGGCYTITPSGNKRYVDRSLCASSTAKPAPKPPPAGAAPGDSGKRYIRGPRGGCYYITASGSKQYVDRSLCQQ
jgi:hypothetical protein